LEELEATARHPGAPVCSLRVLVAQLHPGSRFRMPVLVADLEPALPPLAPHPGRLELVNAPFEELAALLLEYARALPAPVPILGDECARCGRPSQTGDTELTVRLAPYAAPVLVCPACVAGLPPGAQITGGATYCSGALGELSPEDHARFLRGVEATAELVRMLGGAVR
jgi:hypothetical protein